MKILSIIGARPQFIKAAMLSKVWEEHPIAHEVLVHTGQHYNKDMSDVFFDELDLPKPDYNLGVGSGTHGQQTGRMLESLEQVTIREEPDWMVVYGDTNSTLAGALAAVKLHVPVAHVEAGLRSFNRKMPEEINRLVADQLSTLRFTPTKTASTNLINEGFTPQSIHQIGDVMFDAVKHYGERAERNSRITTSVGVEKKAFILATIHRAENTDCPDQLRAIVSGLEAIHKKIPVIWPLHPRTRNALASHGMAPELQLMEPVGYLDMLKLERSAAVVVTDSGGVQKEAFFQQTPCVTVRTETEWVELIESGWNRLANPQDADHIVSSIRAALDSKSVISHIGLYGDGHAAELMVERLGNFSI